MSVTAVNIVNKRAWRDQKGDYRTWTYRVTFSAAPTDPGDALDATDGVISIPDIGDNYPYDSTLKVRKVGEAAMLDGTSLLWEVPVEFSDVSDSDSGGGATQDQDPLARPAETTWGFAVYEKVVERDINGDAVRNSAGDVNDPPVVDEVYRLQVTIERNVASHDPADAWAKINTTNSTAMTISGVDIMAKQALMKDYGAVAAYENGVSFVRQRFVIEFAPDFRKEVLDQGYYGLLVNLRVPILDGNFEPVTRPHFLDGSGHISDVEVYLYFETKEPVNWSALNLPTNFPDT
ncbi:MAG: hypothetical protein U1E51_23210 [Candidatus Binatia bacterium]|nr:hypothetical protein [Candidatus Binatia bacterium]